MKGEGAGFASVVFKSAIGFSWVFEAVVMGEFTFSSIQN